MVTINQERTCRAGFGRAGGDSGHLCPATSLRRGGADTMLSLMLVVRAPLVTSRTSARRRMTPYALQGGGTS